MCTSSGHPLMFQKLNQQVSCSELKFILLLVQDLNGVIAHDLASVLLPAKVRGGHRLSLLSGLLGAIGGHPAYKLASLQSVPQLPASSVAFTSFAWPGLLKRLRQMLVTGKSRVHGICKYYQSTSRAHAEASQSLMVPQCQSAYS